MGCPRICDREGESLRRDRVAAGVSAEPTGVRCVARLWTSSSARQLDRAAPLDPLAEHTRPERQAHLDLDSNEKNKERSDLEKDGRLNIVDYSRKIR